MLLQSQRAFTNRAHELFLSLLCFNRREARGDDSEILLRYKLRRDAWRGEVKGTLDMVVADLHTQAAKFGYGLT